MKDISSFTCDFVHLCDLFFIEPYSMSVSKYWMLLLLVITIENKMSIITKVMLIVLKNKTYKCYTASVIPAIFLPCVYSLINFCRYFSNIHTYMCTYTKV